MANLFQFQERLQKLDNQVVLELILFTEIKRFENIFVNLNKKQLSKGESATGKIFGTYSYATEQIAKTKNPRKPKIAGQLFNFEDTGGLFDGFQLLVDGKQATFWSKDAKTPFLAVKYPDLFGLQKDNLKEVINKIIFPAFMIQIREVLQLR